MNDFYNSIANEYNGHMTESDHRVREQVHHLFKQNVATGNVMDFGGGTGLDLPFLTANNYSVFFVEPSEGMRSVAKANNTSKGVEFIESNVDFTKWDQSNLPFHGKVNGIIANFAVVNCIEDISSLFEKFALISADNCSAVVTVIDYSFIFKFRLIFASKLTILNKSHTTYIHSLRSLKKAAGKYFELQSITQASNFVVLIFRKR